MHERGFSLIELMMVVVIVGLVLAMGLPAFGHYRDELLAGQARAQLMQDLRMARQSAVTQHCLVIMAFGDGSATSNIAGYTVHMDTNGDHVAQASERRFYRGMPGGTRLSLSGLSVTDTLLFDMSGLLWPGSTGGRLVLSTPRGQTDTVMVSSTSVVYRP